MSGKVSWSNNVGNTKSKRNGRERKRLKKLAAVNDQTKSDLIMNKASEVKSVSVPNELGPPKPVSLESLPGATQTEQKLHQNPTQSQVDQKQKNENQKQPQPTTEGSSAPALAGLEIIKSLVPTNI